MPISKKWSRWTKALVQEHDDSFGAYELADRSGHILYIGSGRILSRLTDYIQRILEREVSRPAPEDLYRRVASRTAVEPERRLASAVRESTEVDVVGAGWGL